MLRNNIQTSLHGVMIRKTNCDLQVMSWRAGTFWFGSVVRPGQVTRGTAALPRRSATLLHLVLFRLKFIDRQNMRWSLTQSLEN